jgi:hypothetical protein
MSTYTNDWTPNETRSLPLKKNLSAQITREVGDITDVLRDVVIPKLEDHDERITELENKDGLTPNKH